MQRITVDVFLAGAGDSDDVPRSITSRTTFMIDLSALGLLIPAEPPAPAPEPQP